MPNYANGKIYKLVSDHTNDIYIGSTTKSLRERKAGHNTSYRSYINDSTKSRYLTSFELLKYDDCQIVLIEKYPCVDRIELYARERYYIDNTKNTVNKIIPFRSAEETKEKVKLYQQSHKEQISKYMKVYQQSHKKQLSDYKKQYYDDNASKMLRSCKCVCGKNYTYKNRFRHQKSQHHKFFEQFMLYNRKNHPEFADAIDAMHRLRNKLCEN